MPELEDLKAIQEKTNLSLSECQKYYEAAKGNVPLAIALILDDKKTIEENLNASKEKPTKKKKHGLLIFLLLIIVAVLSVGVLFVSSEKFYRQYPDSPLNDIFISKPKQAYFDAKRITESTLSAAVGDEGITVTGCEYIYYLDSSVGEYIYPPYDYLMPEENCDIILRISVTIYTSEKTDGVMYFCYNSKTKQLVFESPYNDCSVYFERGLEATEMGYCKTKIGSFGHFKNVEE